MEQPLFMALYLDEDVEILVARLVRARGFTAITTQEAEQLGQTDREQLVYATARGYVLVTYNRRHFEQLARTYAAQQEHHAGIIIAPRRSPYDLASRLGEVLDSFTADEMINQLIYRR